MPDLKICWCLISILVALVGVVDIQRASSFAPPLTQFKFRYNSRSLHPLFQEKGDHISDSASHSTRTGTILQSILSTGNETNIQQSRRQQRQFKPQRRPRNYWRDLTNVEEELRLQWESCSVSIPKHNPPPIPNESLLNYWKRHDLRSAIVAHGGRERLSHLLNGAEIIPGKWTQATNLTVIQELVASDPDLDLSVPPLSPQQLKTQRQNHRIQRRKGRWAHSQDRKPQKYWTKKIILEEFFLLLEDRQEIQNIPAVWMPRPAELDAIGRTDLKLAIQRKAGGFARLQRKAGLVRYREWKYFQGMLELQQQLIKYIYEYCDGDCTVFPNTAPMKERGYKWLYDAIHQTYGGRTFVAARLGMKYSTQNMRNSKKDLISSDMSWGPWDIHFGVELLLFVRNDQLKRQPPLTYPVIAMPSPKKLQQRSGEQGKKLHEQIIKYGGYENVARRLGLEYFDNLELRTGSGPVIRFGLSSEEL